jgi:hypothetical protein
MKLYEAGAKFAVFVGAEVAEILTRPSAACQILAATGGDLRTVPVVGYFGPRLKKPMM